MGFATCCVVLALIQWHEFIFSNLVEKTEIIKCWVSNLGIWAPLTYLLGYVLRPLLFFPAVPFAILGGLLFGSFWGTIYVLIGAMCSSVCEFLLVRYFVGIKAKEFLKEKTRRINQVVIKHGLLAVFLVRLIPNIAFDLQNCGLALTPVSFAHYFYGTLLGCIPACIFYASLGNLAFNWSVPWAIGFVVSLGACLYLLRLFFPVIYNKNNK
jgi:uncharacterized membrane protein YdjX (TVP38/TMEM64 family)